MTTLRLGIDIGSTTIKFVVLDENAKIIYKKDRNEIHCGLCFSSASLREITSQKYDVRFL